MFRKDDAALREVVTQHLAAMIADGLQTGHSRQIRAGCGTAVAQPMMNAGYAMTAAHAPHACGRISRYFEETVARQAHLAAMANRARDVVVLAADRARLRRRSDRWAYVPFPGREVILGRHANTGDGGLLAMAVRHVLGVVGRDHETSPIRCSHPVAAGYTWLFRARR